MDRNNDGGITRQEWNGSARSFQVHDWNGDGVCPAKKSASARSATPNWETADHDPNRCERNLNWTRSNFTTLDHNRDGRLTDNEWHFDLETFLPRRSQPRQLDQPAGVPRRRRRRRSRRQLRRSRSATTTAASSAPNGTAAPTSSTRLDRNRDGFLSRYEVVGSQPSFDTYDEFNNLDYDRNGRL